MSGRKVPRPIPCRALLDSGSQSDFISTTLVDQLKLKINELEKPLTLQLAVAGSRVIEYQTIKEERMLDVANLESYDVVLGLPFLVQHKLLVTIRSADTIPFEGDQAVLVASRTAEITNNRIDELREELTKYALDICKEAVETPLPPLRVINHVIPLIDDHKAMKPLWRAKRDDYIRTGRWEFQSAMLCKLEIVILEQLTSRS
ncbi:hypothetical protein BDN70DRAFT_907599 [Pholiota conissans]|uniref:Peptidase aspartic putative domain-containing protein n=1 Tax=Pholiota conissans TaxID=109636 RepID=A0A9P5YYX5_9AGAR|nr:hypothetical protein BDN70DRAFT_907599 [Pholiota conissans]